MFSYIRRLRPFSRVQHFEFHDFGGFIREMNIYCLGLEENAAFCHYNAGLFRGSFQYI